MNKALNPKRTLNSAKTDSCTAPEYSRTIFPEGITYLLNKKKTLDEQRENRISGLGSRTKTQT